MYKKFEVGEIFTNANDHKYLVIKSKEWYWTFGSCTINRHLLFDLNDKVFVIAYGVYKSNNYVGRYCWESGSYPGSSIDEALEGYNKRCEGDNND